MPENTTRITNQAAVTATRAIIGNNCSVDLAVDVIEAVRPHIESPLFDRVKSLQSDLAAAHAEIDRLRAAASQG